jgi:hypothetical protein
MATQGIRVSLAEMVKGLENDPDQKSTFLELTTGKVIVVNQGTDPPGAGPDTHLQVEPLADDVEERLMESFVHGVDDPEVQGKLMAALRGLEARQRFRQVLKGFGGLRQEWNRYFKSELEDHAREWFEKTLGDRDGIDLAG